MLWQTDTAAEPLSLVLAGCVLPLTRLTLRTETPVHRQTLVNGECVRTMLRDDTCVLTAEGRLVAAEAGEILCALQKMQRQQDAADFRLAGMGFSGMRLTVLDAKLCPAEKTLVYSLTLEGGMTA